MGENRGDAYIFGFREFMGLVPYVLNPIKW